MKHGRQWISMVSSGAWCNLLFYFVFLFVCAMVWFMFVHLVCSPWIFGDNTKAVALRNLFPRQGRMEHCIYLFNLFFHLLFWRYIWSYLNINHAIWTKMINIMFLISAYISLLHCWNMCISAWQPLCKDSNWSIWKCLFCEIYQTIANLQPVTSLLIIQSKFINIKNLWNRDYF